MASSTSLRGLSALIVGGGATGRIIGKHLANAGADLCLLLKPEYAAVADQGFELHKLRTFKKKRERGRFDDFKILTDVDQLEKMHFDQVYICVDGPALRTGWLKRAWPHLRHSVWISFQPGVTDREYLTSIIPERFLVMGTIGFIAYRAPLPSEDISPPGLAYWFPPTMATMVHGSDPQVMTAVANLLHSGGLPTVVASDFASHRLYASAAAIPLAASLEIHNWSLSQLRKDRKAIARLCVAVAELANAIEKMTGDTSRLLGWLRKPWFWRFMLKNIDALTPMPLGEYMQEHFLHKRPQTEQQLGDFMTLIKRTGGTPTALGDLAREWARLRGPAGQRQEQSLLAPGGLVASTTERSQFAATGQLGGEVRGKAAADQKARAPGASDSSQSGPFQQPFSSQSGSFQQPQSSKSGSFQQPPASQSGSFQQPPASQSGHSFRPPSESSFGPPAGADYVPDDTEPPRRPDED